MTFIHALQPKVHLRSFDNISEFKIPNKYRLAFLSERSQGCFFEASSQLEAKRSLVRFCYLRSLFKKIKKFKNATGL